MNYTKLDQQHKRQFLANCQALWTAVKCLENITGANGDKWVTEIAEYANQDVNLMSDQEVDAMIAEIEQQSNNFGVIHLKQKKS